MHISDIVEGWTEPLVYQLLDGPDDDTAEPVDLSGKTVAAEIKGVEGTAVDTTTMGKLQVVDAANGKVSFTPVSVDFKASKSPYRARFKVTFGSIVYFYPSSEPFTITVNPVTV